MSVVVAAQMLVLDRSRRAFRRPRPSLRGAIAGLSARTGVVIRFRRSPLVSELIGSKGEIECMTCRQTQAFRHWMPRRIPSPAPGEKMFLDFARNHELGGCRVYGAVPKEPAA